MNRGRKIKHSLSIKDEENNSPKIEPTATATKHKLLTPCRRVGLNRKRKNIISGLSESSSEINISSPNNSLTEIDISVREHDFTPETNKIQIETPVLKKNIKPRKSSLGARKRPNKNANTEDGILSPEEVKKKNGLEPSVDISMRIENEAISSTPVEANNSEIQTNQISTTIADANSAENTSLNESDVTEKNLELDKVSTKSATSKKFKDLFGDNSDDSDFESNLKRKKRKRFSLKTSSKTSLKTNKNVTSLINEDTNDDSTQNSLGGTDTEIPKNKTDKKNKTDENIDKKTKATIKPNKNNEDSNELLNQANPDISKPKTKHSKKEKSKNKIHKRDTDSQNDSDELTELNEHVSRKKRKRSSSSHSKKSPKIINKKESATKPRHYNSDSEDDFMEKPRREKKDPDIKKKINIPAPDPLNRIEHIRIRENKSYTIMHMNNISSYVKYYDNDVNLKRTESDDNQQTTSQPVVSNVKTSMILERKNYLNKGSQEISQSSENSESTNLNSDCNENSEPTNINSDCNENSEPTNINSECNENPEPTNIVSDCVENPETNNVTSDEVTEFSKNRDSIKNAETTNEISDSFAGFSPQRENTNYIENPKSANINIFSLENPDSNDIENSNSNDISNFNDIEKSDSNGTIETPEVSNIETTEVNNIETCEVSNIEKPDVYNIGKPVSIENPESVSDVENPDDPQNEMKKLLRLKSNLINQIKIKRDKLDSLKRIMAYKEEHNLDDLTKTTLQFKYTLQEALVDLLSHLKTHTERNFNMLLLLGFLKIPSEMVGYNDETKSFE